MLPSVRQNTRNEREESITLAEAWATFALTSRSEGTTQSIKSFLVDSISKGILDFSRGLGVEAENFLGKKYKTEDGYNKESHKDFFYDNFDNIYIADFLSRYFHQEGLDAFFTIIQKVALSAQQNEEARLTMVQQSSNMIRNRQFNITKLRTNLYTFECYISDGNGKFASYSIDIEYDNVSQKIILKNTKYQCFSSDETDIVYYGENVKLSSEDTLKFNKNSIAKELKIKSKVTPQDIENFQVRKLNEWLGLSRLPEKLPIKINSFFELLSTLQNANSPQTILDTLTTIKLQAAILPQADESDEHVKAALAHIRQFIENALNDPNMLPSLPVEQFGKFAALVPDFVKRILQKPKALQAITIEQFKSLTQNESFIEKLFTALQGLRDMGHEDYDHDSVSQEPKIFKLLSLEQFDFIIKKFTPEQFQNLVNFDSDFVNYVRNNKEVLQALTLEQLTYLIYQKNIPKTHNVKEALFHAFGLQPYFGLRNQFFEGASNAIIKLLNPNKQGSVDKLKAELAKIFKKTSEKLKALDKKQPLYREIKRLRDAIIVAIYHFNKSFPSNPIKIEDVQLNSLLDSLLADLKAFDEQPEAEIQPVETEAQKLVTGKYSNWVEFRDLTVADIVKLPFLSTVEPKLYRTATDDSWEKTSIDGFNNDKELPIIDSYSKLPKPFALFIASRDNQGCFMRAASSIEHLISQRILKSPSSIRETLLLDFKPKRNTEIKKIKDNHYRYTYVVNLNEQPIFSISVDLELSSSEPQQIIVKKPSHRPFYEVYENNFPSQYNKIVPFLRPDSVIPQEAKPGIVRHLHFEKEQYQILSGAQKTKAYTAYNSAREFLDSKPKPLSGKKTLDEKYWPLDEQLKKYLPEQHQNNEVQNILNAIKSEDSPEKILKLLYECKELLSEDDDNFLTTFVENALKDPHIVERLQCKHYQPLMKHLIRLVPTSEYPRMAALDKTGLIAQHLLNNTNFTSAQLVDITVAHSNNQAVINRIIKPPRNPWSEFFSNLSKKSFIDAMVQGVRDLFKPPKKNYRVLLTNSDIVDLAAEAKGELITAIRGNVSDLDDILEEEINHFSNSINTDSQDNPVSPLSDNDIKKIVRFSKLTACNNGLIKDEYKNKIKDPLEKATLNAIICTGDTTWQASIQHNSESNDLLLNLINKKLDQLQPNQNNQKVIELLKERKTDLENLAKLPEIKAELEQLQLEYIQPETLQHLTMEGTQTIMKTILNSENETPETLIKIFFLLEDIDDDIKLLSPPNLPRNLVKMLEVDDERERKRLLENQNYKDMLKINSEARKEFLKKFNDLMELHADHSDIQGKLLTLKTTIMLKILTSDNEEAETLATAFIYCTSEETVKKQVQKQVQNLVTSENLVRMLQVKNKETLDKLLKNKNYQPMLINNHKAREKFLKAFKDVLELHDADSVINHQYLELKREIETKELMQESTEAINHMQEITATPVLSVPKSQDGQHTTHCTKIYPAISGANNAPQQYETQSTFSNSRTVKVN